MAIDAGSIVAWLELDASQYARELTLSQERAETFSRESESLLSGVVAMASELLSAGEGQTLGNGFLTGIGEGMRSASGTMRSAADDAARGAVKAMSSAFDGAYGLGARMVSSAASGIRASAGSLAAAARSAAAQAASAFQSALGAGRSSGAAAASSVKWPKAEPARSSAGVTVNHYGEVNVRQSADIQRVAEELYGMVRGASRSG